MRKVLYLFGILDDCDVEWLGDAGRVRPVETGGVIITAGKPVDSLFIVLSGELQVYADHGEIARLHSGEVVGEISFVDSRPPLATVKALVDSSVFAVSAELLRRKLAKDPSFAARFYRAVAVFLADRLRSTTSRLGYGQAHQDLAEKVDLDEVHAELIESIDLAATRFDKLLRRLSADVSD